jgi:DNA polymerase-4
VRLRFADFETLTRQTTLRRPNNALTTIRRAARHSLERIALLKKVRLIGIRLSGPRLGQSLTPPSALEP